MLTDYNNQTTFMKTDPVEIFQTIRATLQPYATLGFSNRENSDEVYDLWSNINVEIGDNQRSETFFASVNLLEGEVVLKTGFSHHIQGGEKTLTIASLDDILLNQIEDAMAAGYKTFKEKEWV